LPDYEYTQSHRSGSATEKWLSAFIHVVFVQPLAFLNRNPVMFKIGSYHIVYFGLFAALGVIASLSISFFFLYSKGRLNGLNPMGVALFLLIGDMVGVKAIYIFALGKRFFHNPKAFLNETTMYNQGGLFGVMIVMTAVALLAKIEFFVMFDAIVLGSTFGLFLGRLGCYNYGCCFGIPAERRPSISYHRHTSKVIRTNPELKGVALVPTQLYTAYFDFFMFILFTVLAVVLPWDGVITLVFVFIFNGFRFVIQKVRFVEQSDIVNFSSIAIGYFIMGLALWCGFFLLQGGHMVYRPFYIPFTFGQWAHFISTYPWILLSLLVSGVISFIFYGVHGKELGTHTNIRT
jgi:prolipoprotein diacylglyceryltransferase